MDDLLQLAKLFKEKANEWETTESFIVPMLRHFHWPTEFLGQEVRCYRNSASDFDLVFAKGKDVLLAVEVKRMSYKILASCANHQTTSASNKALPVQVVTYAKERSGTRSRFELDPRFSRVIWTDGVHWVHFKNCAWYVENLSEEFEAELTRTFQMLRDEDDTSYFERMTILNVGKELNIGIAYAKLKRLRDVIGYERVLSDFQSATD